MFSNWVDSAETDITFSSEIQVKYELFYFLVDLRLAV